MPKITLINKSEKNVIEIGESKFFYRRAFPLDWSVIRKKNTQNGVVDFHAAGIELVRTHLLGWENIQDIDGSQVDFDLNLVESLPDAVLADLLNAINSKDVALAEKN